MRKEANPRGPRRRSPNRSTALHDWRSRLRPQILCDLVEQSKDLSWSRRLITLLLDELHVGDEFYHLVDSADPSVPQQYPQLVAIALLLRHSWFPEDLADTAVWLGLSSTHLTEPKLASSVQPATADTAPSAGSPPSTPRTCTPLKGDPTC
jgi:hypothetical protein